MERSANFLPTSLHYYNLFQHGRPFPTWPTTTTNPRLSTIPISSPTIPSTFPSIPNTENIHPLDHNIDGSRPLEKTYNRLNLGFRLTFLGIYAGWWAQGWAQGTLKPTSTRPNHRWTPPPRENLQLFKSRHSTTFLTYVCRKTSPRLGFRLTFAGAYVGLWAIRA